jgi:hypothetical protein
VLRRDKKCLFNLTGRDTWLYETGKSEISYATPRIFLEHSEDLVSYYKLLREEGGGKAKINFQEPHPLHRHYLFLRERSARDRRKN